jgi:hypothetical protein
MRQVLTVRKGSNTGGDKIAAIAAIFDDKTLDNVCTLCYNGKCKEDTLLTGREPRNYLYFML